VYAKKRAQKLDHFNLPNPEMAAIYGIQHAQIITLYPTGSGSPRYFHFSKPCLLVLLVHLSLPTCAPPAPSQNGSSPSQTGTPTSLATAEWDFFTMTSVRHQPPTKLRPRATVSYCADARSTKYSSPLFLPFFLNLVVEERPDVQRVCWLFFPFWLCLSNFVSNVMVI
jgi:hypothetical protein